jgi:2'-5' RNA ligase
MALAVEMFFDEDADAAVRAIWRDLAAAGLPSLAVFGHGQHRPHVSLAVFESLNLDGLDPLRSVLAQAIAQARPVLPLTSLGTFPGGEGVLFLGVTVSTALLDLHARTHAALAGQAAGPWPHYLPGSVWVPHCTLAQSLDAEGAAAAFRRMHGFHPIAATVTSAGLTDTATGAVTPLTG